MTHFNITFKYSESTYCSNIALAVSVEDVKAHYSNYEIISISEATASDIAEAQRKGKPFVECPHIEATTNALLTVNDSKNGFELKFSAKPTDAELAILKQNGFRWCRAGGYWYAKQSAESKAVCDMFAGASAPVVSSSVSSVPSLWDRCNTSDIPEHNRRLDTKTIAAETRNHLKERFPEVSFSCRIGKGGWASANEVNIYFKSAPFSEDSVYFEYVKKYVKAWLDSYNYNNSDYMTDYFDVNFYEYIGTYGFIEREASKSEKATLEQFNKDLAEFEKAEEERKEKEYQAYLVEMEEKRKEAEKAHNIAVKECAEITEGVKVINLAEDEKYLISAVMVCGCGKECSLEDVDEYGTTKEEKALIKRELHFTNDLYNKFCNKFLYDFDFLNGCGGTGTFDERVTDDNIHQLNSEQRKAVEWVLWDCVAVYVDGVLSLIIDPEGYNYSRYVNVVGGEYTKTPLNEKPQEEKKEDFYFPLPIAEQGEAVKVGEDYTLINLDPWSLCATMKYIKVISKDIRDYAQYKNTLYVEYIEKGKKKPVGMFVKGSDEVLIYSGLLAPVPESLTRREVKPNMFELLNCGINAKDFMKSVYSYYKSLGVAPVVNTLQF